MVELLDDRALHASSVVANNAMNRERQLHGVNSHTKALGFDPLTRAGTAWPDLCCGSGQGPRKLDLPYRYLGADDRSGPNYTGQPAVTSYYEKTV